MMTMTTLDAPSQYGLHPTAANRHEHQQLQRSQQQPQQWLEPPDSAPAALPPCQAARGVLPPPPPQPPPPALLSPAASELLAGCIAGAANVVSGYPFDTVKVRLQSSPPGRYRGAWHCLVEVARREGLGGRGLFRGLPSPLLGGAAETGVNYLVYSRVLDALKAKDPGTTPSSGSSSAGGDGGHAHTQQQHPAGGPAPLWAVAAAGAVGGVALSFILGPVELVKCRMQLGGSVYAGGPLQVLKQVVAEEGLLRGLTRGLGATMAREVPGNALFFTAYEALRRLMASSALSSPPPAADTACPEALAQSSSSSSAAAVAPITLGTTAAPPHALWEAATAIFCGGVAGTIMWAAVLPIDVAKTRLQTARPGSGRDVGLRAQWAMLWREGGLRALYSGAVPTLARAFPANACQWLAWEAAVGALRGEGGR